MIASYVQDWQGVHHVHDLVPSSHHGSGSCMDTSWVDYMADYMEDVLHVHDDMWGAEL